MKKLLAIFTATALGLTLGTASADEVNTAPRLQPHSPSPIIVATSKAQVKEREKREKRREKKEKKREKKERIKIKEQKLKLKEKELDRK